MSGRILRFVLILSGLFALRCGAAVYHSNGTAANIQQIHDTQAVDGDTITLPAGTFSWTSSPGITKAITLQGATTVTGAGGPNPTVNDVTIVKDDVSRNSTILSVTISGNRENGNAAWADYPWFGTGKFFFIEDNTLVRQNTMANSLVDSFYGGRWVARHNYMVNMIPSGHGTESGAGRGQRANEFYDNTINMTVEWSGGGQRSGTSLWHDNTFLGHNSDNGSACNLSNFRETPARGIQPSGTFTVADGTCPWDQNDTEGNGTYVEGHPPFLFDSGSPTSGTTISGSRATFTDSTKNWTPNQWAGYSIRDNDPNSASYTLGSYIISNTSNSITYYYYPQNDVNVHLIFNAGGQYQIHRVLVMMDQNGRGRTLDAIYAQIINGQPIPRNPRCTCALWPRSQLEPCYSWNNVYTPTNHVLGFGGGGQPTTKPGVDYFNLGGGFPADSTPSQVFSTYNAARNGVYYAGTFIYPHPLVSAQPSRRPTPAPAPP